MSLFVALLVAAASPVASPAAATPQPDPDRCDNRPVIMVVEGHLRDAARLAVYAEAIRVSGLFQRLGAYYLINPRPVAVFEGSAPPERSILAVRFPCFAFARAFWNARLYREQIVPLRSNPSAGEFTVTVHLELPIPAYMAGRITARGYVRGTGSAKGIAQVTEGAR